MESCSKITFCFEVSSFKMLSKMLSAMLLCCDNALAVTRKTMSRLDSKLAGWLAATLTFRFKKRFIALTVFLL